MRHEESGEARITKGGAEVNGVKVTRPEEKIDTERDTVLFNGMTVGYAEFEYYMLNKPAGVVSATEDRRERTVLDLIDERQRKDLFPVGRLDKDTEGLLLITNDGELAHRLLSPKRHVDKVYYARVAGEITEEHVKLFAAGVDIGDEKPPFRQASDPFLRRDLRDRAYDPGGKIPSGETDVSRCGRRSRISEAHEHGKPQAGYEFGTGAVQETDGG